MINNIIKKIARLILICKHQKIVLLIKYYKINKL